MRDSSIPVTPPTKQHSLLCEWLGKINTYGYTIIFFVSIIAVVYVNENQDLKKLSVLNQIESDFESSNGKEDFFDKIVAFNQGKDLTLGSSIFSFKKISYRLSLNKTLSKRRSVVRNPLYFKSNYYVNTSQFQYSVNANTPYKIVQTRLQKGETNLANYTIEINSGRPIISGNSQIVGDTVIVFYDAIPPFAKHSILNNTPPNLRYVGLFKTSITYDFFFKSQKNQLFYKRIQSTNPMDSLLYVLKIPQLDSISSILQDASGLDDVKIRGYFNDKRREVRISGNPFRVHQTDGIWSFDADYYGFGNGSIDMSDENFVYKNYLISDTLKNLSKKLKKKNIKTVDLYNLEVGRDASYPAIMDVSYGDEQEIKHDFSLLTKDSSYVFNESTGSRFKAVINGDIVFRSENSENLDLYKISSKQNPQVYHPSQLTQDSAFFDLLSSDYIVSPVLSPDGVAFYVPDDTGNFFVLSRTIDGKVTAYYSPATWQFKDYRDNIVHTVSYDVYYIIIFVCSVVIFYFLGLILINAYRIKNAFTLSDIPKLDVGAIDYKLQSIYTNMETLKNRSEWMLLLGVFFGVFGVLVSAFVFKMANLDLKGGWSDPHTYISLLKPMIILVFMETFTFYFLKQYRIIFNEYKLFYSLFLSNLNINVLANLKSINKIEADSDLYSTLKAKIASENFNLYETGTKSQVDEFERKSVIDLVSNLKDLVKK